MKMKFWEEEKLTKCSKSCWLQCSALLHYTTASTVYEEKGGWEELSATEGADLLNRNLPVTEINTCGSSSEEHKIEGRLMYSFQPIRFSQSTAFADHEGMKKINSTDIFIYIYINQKY